MARCYPMCPSTSRSSPPLLPKHPRSHVAMDDNEMVCLEVPAYKVGVDSLATRPGFGSAGKSCPSLQTILGFLLNCPAIYHTKFPSTLSQN